MQRFPIPPLPIGSRTAFVLLLPFLWCYSIPAVAQLGVQLHARLPVSLAESSDLPDPLIQAGYGVGLVYSLRHRNVRIEWLPGIHILRTRAEPANGEGHLTGTGVQGTLDLRMYPLDLQGDCMCPTFSRKGQLLEKGLFLEVGAGWTQLSQKLSGGTSSSGNALARLGAGLDIGLSHTVTITPGVRLQYEPGQHAWGTTRDQQNSRNWWVSPFLQCMVYFKD